MPPKIIHHNDCTWCKHRIVLKPNKNKKGGELERCQFDNWMIPAPREGSRYCALYQQENCPCPSCTLTIPHNTIPTGRLHDKL